MVPNQQMKKNILINYTGKYEGAFLASVYIKVVIVKQGTSGYYSGSEDIKAIYQIEIARDFTIRKTRR